MSSDEAAVVAVVTFPVMQQPSGEALRQLLEQAGPDYIDVPGLRRKYFISGDGVGGGIYEWESRRHADAFYDEAWHAEAQMRFGAIPEIVFYDAPAIADGVNHRLEIYLS
ncbi:MAG: monooxygenase [Gammaproteobacteria bacterium]